jgi:hypothetical protein
LYVGGRYLVTYILKIICCVLLYFLKTFHSRYWNLGYDFIIIIIIFYPYLYPNHHNGKSKSTFALGKYLYLPIEVVLKLNRKRKLGIPNCRRVILYLLIVWRHYLAQFQIILPLGQHNISYLISCLHFWIINYNDIHYLPNYHIPYLNEAVVINFDKTRYEIRYLLHTRGHRLQFIWMMGHFTSYNFLIMKCEVIVMDCVKYQHKKK